MFLRVPIRCNCLAAALTALIAVVLEVYVPAQGQWPLAILAFAAAAAGFGFGLSSRRRMPAPRGLAGQQLEHELFRALVENRDCCMIICNLAGGTLYLNRAARAWIGGEEKSAAFSITEFLSEPGRVTDATRRCAAGETVPPFEGRLRAEGGKREIDVECDVFAIVPPGQSRPAAIAYCCRDISEMKAAERALRENETNLKLSNAALEKRVGELQTLLEISPVGIALGHDAECSVITLNPALARMLGVARHGGLSLTANNAEQLPFQFVTRNGVPLAEGELPMEKAVRLGRPIVNEKLELIRKDGRRLNLFSHAAPVFNSSGQITGCLGMYVDVTSLIKAESALRLSEERMRVALQNAPISVAMLDCELRHTWLYNPIFALPAHELIGKRLDEALPGSAAGELIALQQEVVLRGASVRREVRCQIGGQLWVYDVTGEPLRSLEGEVIGVTLAALNITGRKRAEEERLSLLASERAARAEAERLNRLKDEFLATLSHELRTPLNAILGWLQLLRKEGLAVDERQRGLDVVERSAKAQAELIDDLLDMSRIISGKVRIEARLLDLQMLLDTVLESARPAAEAKGISLLNEMQGPPCIVRGDASRLQQVFWNLLSNAIKFTNPGGEVRINSDCGEGWVRVMVRDTGKGIHPDFLPHIFERFRQADASTRRRHGGLGLGLAIAKQLVELHGGTIGVTSAGEDRGALFAVTLPLSSLAAALPFEAQNGQGGVRCLKGLRVLAVDDDADALELVRRFLCEGEAEVQTAVSVAAAVAALSVNTFDVVVSDIGMPEQDGYDLLRYLRERVNSALPPTPVIALTALARPADVQRALSAGFAMHLSKPINAALLLDAVSKAAQYAHAA